jgi:hypothetical protein
MSSWLRAGTFGSLARSYVSSVPSESSTPKPKNNRERYIRMIMEGKL